MPRSVAAAKHRIRQELAHIVTMYKDLKDHVGELHEDLNTANECLCMHHRMANERAAQTAEKEVQTDP